MRKGWNHLECHIPKCDLNDLTVTADAGVGIGLLNRRLDRLQQRRLTVEEVGVVLGVQRPRQLEDHVDVADAPYRGISTVGAHVQAMRRRRGRAPKIGVQTGGQCCIAGGNAGRGVDLQIVTKGLKPVGQSHDAASLAQTHERSPHATAPATRATRRTMPVTVADSGILSRQKVKGRFSCSQLRSACQKNL